MTTSSLMAIPVTDILQSASAAANPTAGMASQFAQAMQAAPLNGVSDVGATSTVAKALIAQDQATRERSDRMRDMALAYTAGDAKALDDVHRVELYNDLAVASFQFNACVNLAQGAKNGMQTLMKNQ